MKYLFCLIFFFHLSGYAQNDHNKWIYTPDNLNEIFLIDKLVPVIDSGFIIQGRVRGETDLNFSVKTQDTAFFNFKKETHFIGKYNKDFGLQWIRFLYNEDNTQKNFNVLINTDIQGNTYTVVNHDNKISFIEDGNSLILEGNYNIIRTDIAGKSIVLHNSFNTSNNYAYIQDMRMDSLIYLKFYSKGKTDLNFNMGDTLYHYPNKPYLFKYCVSKYDLNFKMVDFFYDTSHIYPDLTRDNNGNSFGFSQLNLKNDGTVLFDFKNGSGQKGGFKGYHYYLTGYDKDLKLTKQKLFLSNKNLTHYDLMSVYHFQYDRNNNVYIIGRVYDTFDFEFDGNKNPKYIYGENYNPTLFFAKYDKDLNLKWVKSWQNSGAINLPIINPFKTDRISFIFSCNKNYYLDPDKLQIAVNAKDGYTAVEFDTSGNLTKYILPRPLLFNASFFRSYDSSIILLSKLNGIVNVGTAKKDYFIAGLNKSVIFNLVDEVQANNIISTTIHPIIVFPNPASDQLEIRSDLAEIKSVEIFNIEGKQVTGIPDYNQQRPMDISTLKNGIYILRLRDDTNNVYTIRFVKI